MAECRSVGFASIEKRGPSSPGKVACPDFPQCISGTLQQEGASRPLRLVFGAIVINFSPLPLRRHRSVEIGCHWQCGLGCTAEADVGPSYLKKSFAMRVSIARLLMFRVAFAIQVRFHVTLNFVFTDARRAQSCKTTCSHILVLQMPAEYKCISRLSMRPNFCESLPKRRRLKVFWRK